MLSFVAMEILDKITIGTTVVAAGLHEGRHEMDQNLLSPDEIAIINELSPRKRSEWLASRLPRCPWKLQGELPDARAF